MKLLTPLRSMASLVALALVLGFPACSGGSRSPTPSPLPPSPPPPPVTGAIPRLAAGPHIGYIEGFDDLSPKAGEPDRMARADKLREEAITAGMTIGRVQVDWGGLETAPGVFDADELDDRLNHAGRGGMAIYVTLSTIDISELTIPADLVGPDNLPLNGMMLDDPVITARFHAFLDWLVPRLAARDVWGISLGNEVDGIVHDDVLTEAEVLGHLLDGVDHVSVLDPDIAVTVTLTGDANVNVSQFTDDLIAGLDIVAFNTYCLKADLTVSSPAEWVEVLSRWRQTAGEKEIFIQELGCPVGYGDDGVGAPARPLNGLGGSLSIQADYFAYNLEQFALVDQLRAATVFQLYDWSPDLAGIYTQMFIDSGAPLAGARLEEWMATVGMCRWADATCRPAWDEYLAGLTRIKSDTDR